MFGKSKTFKLLFRHMYVCPIPIGFWGIHKIIHFDKTILRCYQFFGFEISSLWEFVFEELFFYFKINKFQLNIVLLSRPPQYEERVLVSILAFFVEIGSKSPENVKSARFWSICLFMCVSGVSRLCAFTSKLLIERLEYECDSFYFIFYEFFSITCTLEKLTHGPLKHISIN